MLSFLSPISESIDKHNLSLWARTSPLFTWHTLRVIVDSIDITPRWMDIWINEWSHGRPEVGKGHHPQELCAYFTNIFLTRMALFFQILFIRACIYHGDRTIRRRTIRRGQFVADNSSRTTRRNI